jgi:hypothetical protein
MNSQEFEEFTEKEMKRENHEFRVDDGRVMYFKEQMCVPNDVELKKKILGEAHKGRYTVQIGETKMYQDLKKVFWVTWNEEKCCAIRICVLDLSKSKS